MKLQILGTAAYERVPAMFCTCPICTYALKHGGKDRRTQASVLINEDLLVDFGQDNYLHFLDFGVDFKKVRNILITHAHSDHFMPGELQMTKSPYGHNDIASPIQLFGGTDCTDKFKINQDPCKAEFNTVEAYQTFPVGNYTVTALPARHGTADPFIYIISDGNTTLLYDNDSGIWFDEVYDFIGKGNYRFDGVICDCTNGLLHFDQVHGHKSLIDNQNHRSKLMQLGVVTPDTKWIITHFSHNGLVDSDKQPLTHDALSKKAADMGMICAYDGMELEL